MTGKADRCGLMCAGLRGQGGLKPSISKKVEDVHPLLCGLLSLVFITVRGRKKRVAGGPCLQAKGNQCQDPLTCCFIPSQLLTKYLNHTLPFSNYLQNEGRKVFTSTKSSWFHKLSLRRLIWYSKSYNG